MTADTSKSFIKDELYHELCCLLEAATLWQIHKNNNDGCEVSVVMDSAFLHARNLFIFFAPTKNDKANNNSIKVTEFGPSKVYNSAPYSVWKEALNRHLFHLDTDRMKKPTNLKNSGHLNTQVIVFAKEILRLWEQFENDPEAEDLKDVVHDARLRALKDARNTGEGRIDPLFA